MAGLVTKETDRSIENYLSGIGNSAKVADSRILIDLMQDLTGKEAKVWGNEKVPDFLIGFGKYNYRRKGGKETFTWFKIGFAPRKNKITVYLNHDITSEPELLRDLGKYKYGKGCLYLNKLADVNLYVLQELLKKGLAADKNEV